MQSNAHFVICYKISQHFSRLKKIVSLFNEEDQNYQLTFASINK